MFLLRTSGGSSGIIIDEENIFIALSNSYGADCTIKTNARTKTMLRSTIKDIIVSRITSLCGKCTIYLFGSYAYGNPTLSSDVDIAVIMDNVESNVAKAAELWDALRDVNLPKDIIVASKEEFDFYKVEAGSVFMTIAQKGIILNAA